MIETLKNGVTVITDHVPSVESVALGIWIKCGTRDEEMRDNGVAHMVEHMLFKGTNKRNALEIAEQIEDVGGNMNAYTSRDVTAYFIHLLKEDAELAADMLCDMVQNSTFPDEEIERERGVILQEIGMTLDTPDDLIFDLYQETAYPDQTFGAPILGRSDIIKSMGKDRLQYHVKHHYTPRNLVISASGNIQHDDLVQMIESRLSNLPTDNDFTSRSAQYKGGEHRLAKDLEQAHIVLGFETPHRTDKRFPALRLLSTVLGGGMSSRLFQEVREKRGLVYTIFSSQQGYVDAGQFVIYAGTGGESLPELMPVIADELKKVANDVISEAELSRAKAQLKSSLLMSRESMMSRANAQAKYFINKGEELDIARMVNKIESVSNDDIRTIASEIFATAPTLTALGPIGQLEDFDSLKARL